MRYRDRVEAGQRLAVPLMRYAEREPIVLALPRGGVEVGLEIARALGAPLEVFVARKIGAPGQEELGIGAIAPGGVRVLDDFPIRMLGITDQELDAITERERQEMERRLHLYRGDRPEPALTGRTVILVDDGLATGVTARAAIESIRRQNPGRLVLAVPVCAPETAEAMQELVDDLVCPEMPPDFRAVGLWYDRFDQLTDQQVLDMLAQARSAAQAVSA